MRPFIPGILCLFILGLTVIISVYLIAPETNRTKRGILNLIQVFLYVLCWQLAEFVYVDKLQLIDNSYYIFIPVMAVAVSTAIYDKSIFGYFSWKRNKQGI